MEDAVRFCVDDVVDASQEIIVDLFFPEVHAGVRVEPGEGGEAQVRVGDVDEFYWLLLVWIFLGYLVVGGENITPV